MNFFSRGRNAQGATNDEQAVERYRYMLRTAPPETIEQAHEEAFSRLTPEQRRMVLEQLTAATPAGEARGASDSPVSLARMATRAEVRQPGILERIFGGGGMGAMGGGIGGGMGGMLAGGLLASIAGSFIGSSIAHSFFDEHPYQSEFGGFGGDEGQAGFTDSGNSDAGEVPDSEVAEFADVDADLGGGDFGDMEI